MQQRAKPSLLAIFEFLCMVFRRIVLTCRPYFSEYGVWVRSPMNHPPVADISAYNALKGSKASILRAIGTTHTPPTEPPPPPPSTPRPPPSPPHSPQPP